MDGNYTLNSGRIPYWNILKNLSDNVKLELISLLSDSLLQREVKAKDEHWADQFAGLWRDDRTTESIIKDIRTSRTKNRVIESL